MTRLALRGLAARPLRSALTALAVLLGVTMISGTFVLTDTIKRAFDDLFVAGTRGADAIVSGRVEIDSDFVTPPPLDAGLLARIRALPEVADVAGQINDFAAVIGSDGELIKTGGAPTLAATWMPKPFDPIQIDDGRPPTRAGEIALDKATVEEEGFELGEPVRIAAGGPVKPYTLVGVASFGEQTSLGGATVVVFDLASAQEIFKKPGKVDFGMIAAKDGVSPDDLVRAVGRVIPGEAEVRTAADEADKQGEEIGEVLGYLTTGLLAFGFIAVLVGAFLIFNTFSITVAQRTRALALLRALGATRRQVLASVLLEALVVGILGAALGLVAGLGFAQAINTLFEALDIDLPTTSQVLLTRTVVVCLVVGILVTVAGALGPAVRATRVAPVEALRDASAPPRHTLWTRALPFVAGAVVLLGAGLVAAGLLSEGGDATTKLASAAGGSVVLILGIALISPRLVPRTARIIGAPLERSTALVGRLARENATRNPGRTAVTAAALMIGLALVVFVTVFANGLSKQVEDVLDKTFAGDLSVLHEDGFSPIPAGVVDAVRGVPGVGAVSPTYGADSEIEGRKGTIFVQGIDPATITRVYNFAWVDGSDDVLATLGASDVLLEEETADEVEAGVGDEVTINGTGQRSRTFTVRGVYSDDAMLSGYALPQAGFDELFDETRIFSALVDLDEGAGPGVKTAVNAALEGFPEARARDNEELEEEFSGQIMQILGLFYALLAMSVLISAFGIVNTLTLSIHERTRELGLLRAVGMTRKEVRRMIRYESVITACFGALLGLLLGVFFAFVVVQALAEEGIGFSLPLGQVVALLVFAILVGVLAAILPARRAARLDVLEAISYE